MTQLSQKTIDFVEKTVIDLEKTQTQPQKLKEYDGEVTPFSPPLPLHYPLMAFIIDILAIISGFILLGLNLPLEITAIGAIAVPHAIIVFGIISTIWLSVFFLTSVYDLEDVDNYQWTELRKVSKSIIISYFMSMGVLYLIGWQISQTILFQHLLLGIGFALGWRSIFHSFAYFNFVSNTKLHRRVLVISSQERLTSILALLRQVRPEYVTVVGVITDAKSVTQANLLGGFDKNLKALIKERNIDDVVMAFTHKHQDKSKDILKKLSTSTVGTYILPDYMDIQFTNKIVNRLDNLNIVNITPPQLNRVDLFLKRILDITVSLIALVIAGPVMAMIAVAIKLESGGPVLFMQERMGKNKEKFSIFKFRSMRVGADKELDSVSEKDALGRITNHKRPNDPRVTRVGKFIRKTSLDELPQIFNVLRGDMSIVGPRPEILRLVNQYEPWQDKRFVMTQGITGWWQVNGRSENPCHLSTHQDIEYINNFSFLLDIRIILMTVPALLKGKGAF